MSKAIPTGFHTVTPLLAIDGAAKAIDLYTKAFGAKEEGRMTCPETGKIMHTMITIGNSILMLSDTFPGCAQASNTAFYLYLNDVDSAFKKARDAGLNVKEDLKDMFWGDRTGTLTDPFGIQWTLATHTKDLSKDQIEKAAKEWATQMKDKKAA